ncbi:hypothetical protein [Mesorhizobium sp.]|nr:hypothetical protein [Mesorhizobium sp.]
MLFPLELRPVNSLEPGQNRSGPHLSGVVGRTAGSVEGARFGRAARV